MREYGKVFTRIWASDSFRSMSEDGRSLALYLLTCEHGTISGVFRLPDGYASEDLQWTPERVRKGFDELFANGFATRCKDTHWVWIKKFLEWNPPENPNQRKAAIKQVSQVSPKCLWLNEFLRSSGQELGLDSPPPATPPGNPSPTVPEPGAGAGAGAVPGAVLPTNQQARAENAPFPMTPDWRPGETFSSIAKPAGLIPPTGADWDAALAEFVSYWLTQPGIDRTQSEWEHALVKSLKHSKGSARGGRSPTGYVPSRKQTQLLTAALMTGTASNPGHQANDTEIIDADPSPSAPRLVG